jgi:hypothetical protein
MASGGIMDCKREIIEELIELEDGKTLREEEILTDWSLTDV